jgi:hypothetical protein
VALRGAQASGRGVRRWRAPPRACTGAPGKAPGGGKARSAVEAQTPGGGKARPTVEAQTHDDEARAAVPTPGRAGDSAQGALIGVDCPMDRNAKSPCLVAFTTARKRQLLDLTGTWPTLLARLSTRR